MLATVETIDNLTPIERMTRDIAKAGLTLSRGEARFLVDTYYTMQEQRIRTANQVRALNESGEPHDVIKWFLSQSETLEKQVARALDKFSLASHAGQWAREQVGIGPVIAAGLLAYIDIEKAPTVGHIWSFAGLDPNKEWNKGEKRPWCAQLKTLCWKIGESFVKVSNNEKAVYAHYYVARKEQEIARNERGEFAEQAKAKLEKYKIGKTTEAYGHYSSGKLPPAHIHARAKRYAVKLFLSHLHEVMYVERYGTKPPLPYPIAIQGHAHIIEPTYGKEPLRLSEQSNKREQ